MAWWGKNRANFHIGSSYTSNQKGHWFIIHRVCCFIFGQYNLRNFWMPSVLVFCAGGKMGIVASKKRRQLDILIKSLNFYEHRDFLMSTIRCHINACRGRYAVEDNYWEVFRHNMAESAQDFFMTWNEQIELFILFVVMAVLLWLLVVIWAL